MRESSLDVVGIIGAVEVLGVATVAIGGRPFITAPNMTRQAIQRGMYPGQREARKLSVIELRAQPGIPGEVTVLARGRESECLVVGHRVLILNLVAEVTVSREPLELTDSQSLVARVAVHRGMGANQRKAVLMLLNRRQRNTPSFHCMALLAGRAKLTAMDVGVAVSALCSHVAEHLTRVTLHASQLGMTAAKGIPRLIVIELGHTSNWPP